MVFFCLLDLLRLDAMSFSVESHLFFPSALSVSSIVRFMEVRDLVCIHDDATLQHFALLALLFALASGLERKKPSLSASMMATREYFGNV